jgi:hypothetical protein
VEKVMAYVSNLTELEKNLNTSYFNYIKKDNPKTRDSLFLSIRNIAEAVAIADRSTKKYNLELDEISNEYALRLFERIVVGGFRFKTDTGRIPFTAYVRVNIKDVLISDGKNNSYLQLHGDMETLYDQIVSGEVESESDKFSKEYISGKIYNGLLIFYRKNEIKRHLNLALDIIFRNKHQPILHDRLPPELRDFCVVLISIAKRLSHESDINYMERTDIKKAMENSIRSSVFIAAVTNAEAFPKELLLSLDLESLYRLCTVSGGRKIKVPTLRQLDTIVGAINSVSEHIIDGRDYKDALAKSKVDMDLVFSSKTNIHHFISRAIDVLDLKETPSNDEPLIKVLSASKNAINKYVSDMVEENKSHRYRESLLQTVREHKKFLEGLEERLEELPW